jgi:ubiquinone/menaquinone biosynthesis C-methylase UbiE
MQKPPPPIYLRTLPAFYVLARALHVVAELGVADHLGEEPRDAAALAVATGTGALPDRLHRLMRLLASQGVFEMSEEGRFHHNEESRLLRSDHPQSMRDYVVMLGMPAHWQAFAHLKHAVLTGETGFSRAFDAGVFEYFSQNPEEAAAFDRAMRSKAQSDIAAVLGTYDFSDAGTVVDVGGGGGHLLAAILERTGGPGILFDLPAVTERTRAAGVHQFEIAAGDFFADPLPQGDTYLLMHILHDWVDDEALKILAAIRRAARPGARVLVIEMPVPEGSTPHPAQMLDVIMMAITGGRERTQAEYANLMAASGWQFARLLATPGPMAILEGVAA